MDSGECAVAPSTPKPPARLTAATTSRQWLKARSGNSMPSISQIGVFIFALPAAVSSSVWSCATLAHQGRPSQAGLASRRCALAHAAHAFRATKYACGHAPDCLLHFRGPRRMLATNQESFEQGSADVRGASESREG